MHTGTEWALVLMMLLASRDLGRSRELSPGGLSCLDYVKPFPARTLDPPGLLLSLQGPAE